MSLSKETMGMLKGLVEVLEEYGESIVSEMYTSLFNKYPDVGAMFNSSHLGNGDKSQINLLHHALIMYFKYIDQLDVIYEVIERTVDKHSSNIILPEHYDIVGECLIGAIQKVLSLESSSDEIKAIAQGYELLANTLIQMEASVYNQKSITQDGGNLKFLNSSVSRKQVFVNGDEEFVQLTIQKPKSYPAVKPLQYISFYFPKLNTTRQYSVVSDNGSDITICVKRDLKSRSNPSVSNYIYDDIEVGSLLSMGMPSGGFSLDALKGDLCVISAGIGLTSHFSLFNWIKFNPSKLNRTIHFKCVKNGGAYLSKELDDICFSSNVDVVRCYSNALEGERYMYDYEYDGRFKNEMLSDLLSDICGTTYFICAPKEFSVNVHRYLVSVGVPTNKIHCDFYGPTPVQYYQNRIESNNELTVVV